jgi:hypothetical protein
MTCSSIGEQERLMELVIVSFVLWGLVSLVFGLIWPSS